MLLQGKKIIVTAGVTGTGKAAAEQFVREGAIVTTMSRKLPTDKSVVAALEKINSAGPGRATHIQVDVSDQDMVNKAFDEAAERMGGLDVMANLAGIERTGPAEALTKELLYEMLDVHLLGTVFTNAAAFRHMKEKGGSIINTGSVCGVEGLPYYGAYGAAKAGVAVFTRIAAKEWGQYNIRVNTVAISSKTEFAEKALSRLSPEELAEIDADLKRRCPLGGRMGTPHECASVYTFLASDLSIYMSGQLLFADGGYVMVR